MDSKLTKENLKVDVRALDELKALDLESLSTSHNDFDVGMVRGLKSRHIQLIALGGAIGTGLFVGSGSGLATCGPGGLLVGYMVLSLFLWFTMSELVEMSTLGPVPGEATFYAMSNRYVSRSFSFTAGWNIYFAQLMIPPAEITACAFVIEYWTDLNPAIFITIFAVLTIAINTMPVNFFGESEFYVCLIKIFCIVGLILMGIVMFFGGCPKQHGVLGFKYWQDPGAFVEHLVPGNTGKFLACWTGIVKAGFAFILVPELITSTALEAEYPRRNLPIVGRRYVYRLCLFYIASVVVIGVIVASDDSGLMGAISSGSSSAKASPFVIAMNNFGVSVLPHIVNACILTSAYSCGSSMLYGSSRALFSMALKGDAPKLFAKTTKKGVPIYAVAFNSLFTMLAYLNLSDSASTVFTWLSNIATIAGFTSWCFVSITYIRFRKAVTVQDLDDRIPYRPPFQRVGAYAGAVFYSILVFTNGYSVFIKGNWSVSDFFSAYVTVIIDAVLLVGALTYNKEWTKIFRPPSEVKLLEIIEVAEAEEREHQIMWEEKWASKSGLGWKIYNWIF